MVADISTLAPLSPNLPQAHMSKNQPVARPQPRHVANSIPNTRSQKTNLLSLIVSRHSTVPIRDRTADFMSRSYDGTLQKFNGKFQTFQNIDHLQQIL